MTANDLPPADPGRQLPPQEDPESAGLDHEQSEVFEAFREQYNAAESHAGSEEEEAFMQRIADRLNGLAKRQLTAEVRRMCDTHDIASTVMRKVVRKVRSGTLRLETEAQFMSMLGTLTQHAVIEKHRYLTSMLRDQRRTHGLAANRPDDDGAHDWDLTAADDVRRQAEEQLPQTPVDSALLAEKTVALNELCQAVRRQLQKDEWDFFKARFLEERPWKEIADRFDILNEEGQPSADAARMQMTRMLRRLRPRLRKYEQWLQDRPC